MDSIPALCRVGCYVNSRPGAAGDLHPETAAPRKIADGAWVDLLTPHGRARMQARLVEAIDTASLACQPLPLPHAGSR
jgi:hypothetical protein